MKKASIAFNVLGVLLLIYAVIARIKVSGFNLLYTDSWLGFILASTHTFAVLMGAGCVIMGTILLFLNRSICRKKEITKPAN